MRSLTPWSTLLLAVFCGCTGPDRQARLTPEQSQAIDQLVAREMKAGSIPGIAVAVIQGGSVVKRTTLGVADVAHATPVSPSTPFQLASTTKSFVSTGVLLLVSDGRLALDAPVGQLLDGLPASWQPVTVRQLLSHTSGLPDIVRTPGQLDLIADSWEQALLLVEHVPLQFAPGQKWAYTQTNYVLLAQIIRRLSGKPLEAFLEGRVFQPLGMRDTFYPSPGTPRSCAANYARSTGSTVALRHLDFPPFVHAAGGLCSSLDDMIRWNLALDSGRVLRPDLTAALWTTTRLKSGSPARISGNIGYGLGWVVDDTPGHKAVGHSGGNSTAYRRYLSDGMSIIVLHNGTSDPDGLISSIAAIAIRAPGDTGPSAQERLWDASGSGDEAAIARALDDGADIEALDTRRSRNGRRPLNWAAFSDRPEAVRLLLARGAAVNATNKSGYTALHHAAESGSMEVVKLLLAAGANPALTTRDGERAADIARLKGHPEIAVAINAARAK